MGMFGNKKKKKNEAAQAKVQEKPVKAAKKKAGLSQVLNESVPATVDAELRENEPCIRKVDGEDKFVALLFHVADIGGLDNLKQWLKKKAKVFRNLETARNFGVDMPKVAPLAAVEVVNPKMPVTVEAAELTRGGLDVALPAKAGVHRHDENHVEVVDDRLEGVDRGRGVDRNGRAGATLVDERDETVRMGRCLVVKREVVRTSVEVLLDHLVRVGDHEVNVNGKLGGRLHRAQDVKAKREVGDKVAVHDVVVNEVPAFDVRELRPQTSEVSGEDGRGDLDLFQHR